MKNNLTTNVAQEAESPAFLVGDVSGCRFIRTCSEICIDANNNSDDFEYISNLWKEVVFNKYEYCLVELKFMLEHLENYARELGKRDSQLLKQLLLDDEFFGFR